MSALTIMQITAVSLIPNPVNINSSLAIKVTVTESTVTLLAEPTYSGDCFSGDAYSQGG